MSRLRRAALVAAMLPGAVPAQERFKRTDSERGYAHHLELLDAAGREIDPTAADAPPFSSHETCKKCHDVAAIAHGWHFNAASTEHHGRPGEPWILVDARTGTQIPISHRGWPGTWTPAELGLDPMGFLREFGRHLAGGAASYAGADPAAGRFAITGDLPIDCMVCHGADRSWSHERWAATTKDGDFAWASAAAMGIAQIDGSTAGLPDDLDVAGESGRARLPKTRYDLDRFDSQGRTFFDVVREPSNEACYTCHSEQAVGADAAPRWLHDGDVHLRAGMTCVDCHGNGIDHHMVRGFEEEVHPSGHAVDTLSCRGCHLDRTDGHGGVVARGGRFGAPRPRHAGLPPIHLERLSCTACHSGSRPAARAGRVQTSRAHSFGIPSQTRDADDLPAIAAPVLRRNAAGVVEPTRTMWPSFWAYERDGRLQPILPDDAYRIVRRTMRVRQDLRAELAADAAGSRDKLVGALQAFQASAAEGARAVFVAAGLVHRLDEDGEGVRSEPHAAARPYAWPLAHDVRPARASLGARGCTECHAGDAPFVHGTVGALGPLPADTPRAVSMRELMELDPRLIAAWERSFAGRGIFKVAMLAAAVVIALVLLLQLIVGVDAVVRAFAGRKRSAAP